MLVMILLMVAIASLSAFAAPIGPYGLGTPPLRMAPGQPAAPAEQPARPPATVPPAPGSAPRGSLLNLMA